MEIRESELPGIGKKFVLTTESDEKIVTIIHDDGKREVYHYDPYDKEESISSVTLSDEEARNFAAIMGGMVYKPKEMDSIEHSIGDDFRIKWCKVVADSPASGKTIGDIDIRNKYGIMIIAIIQKDKNKILNPGPQTSLQEGDTLVISGAKQNVKNAVEELLYKGGS